jgi:hypothetical protein
MGNDGYVFNKGLSSTKINAITSIITYMLSDYVQMRGMSLDRYISTVEHSGVHLIN